MLKHVRGNSGNIARSIRFFRLNFENLSDLQAYLFHCTRTAMFNSISTIVPRRLFQTLSRASSSGDGMESAENSRKLVREKRKMPASLVLSGRCRYKRDRRCQLAGRGLAN